MKELKMELKPTLIDILLKPQSTCAFLMENIVEYSVDYYLIEDHLEIVVRDIVLPIWDISTDQLYEKSVDTQ